MPKQPATPTVRPACDLAWIIAVAALVASACLPSAVTAQQDDAAKTPAAEEPAAKDPAAEEPVAEPVAGDAESVPEPQDPPAEEQPAEPAAELPADFKPPGVIPPDISLEKPLMTEEEEQALKKELNLARYTVVLRDGNLNQAGVPDLLKKIAKYDVYRLSMPKYRRNLHERRDDLMQDIRNSASLAGAGQQADAFRTFFLQQVVERTQELFDGNFYVRLNGALVLAHMNFREATQNAPEVPFAPALKPLFALLNSDEQRQAVKIVAARGIHRMSLAGIPSETERIEIATRIISELKNPKSIPWYQRRLAETLSSIDLTVDRENRAFIIHTLTEVVADAARHWTVRTEAAKGLGRAKMNASINLKKVIYEIVRLGREMIDAYNHEPNMYYWKGCFLNLYLTFQPLEDEKQLKAGFKSRDFGDNNGIVDSAYQQLHPLAAHVVDPTTTNPGPIPQPRINALEDWLKSNVPENNSVGPNLPPLTNLQAQDAVRLPR